MVLLSRLHPQLVVHGPTNHSTKEEEPNSTIASPLVYSVPYSTYRKRFSAVKAIPRNYGHSQELPWLALNPFHSDVARWCKLLYD